MMNSRIRRKLSVQSTYYILLIISLCSHGAASSIRKAVESTNESGDFYASQKQQQQHHAYPVGFNPKVPISKIPSGPVVTHAEEEHQLNEHFMRWCASVGIKTSLKIQTFDYPDFMRDHVLSSLLGDDDDDDDDLINCDSDDEFTDCTSPILKQLTEYQKRNPPEHSIPVRGLAAQGDIAVGDVVISIPFSSMISIPTTIDEDPVLRKVMGPDVRHAFNWEEDEFNELLLLAVALLYHRRLGKASDMYHYIQLLERSPTQNIPFLWNKSKLIFQNEGIRRHARGIRKEVKDMYKSIVANVLKRDFPEIFARDDTYSLQNFLWAFALVNSRHWHLPIPDFNATKTASKRQSRKVEEEERHSATFESFGDMLPPASSPTERFVREEAENMEKEPQQVTESQNLHSFLAPVADLLNFGPPCTRSSYNDETRAFELVATCAYSKGQEVTYWYSDDCDDIIIANYGFTHPLVPSCPTVDDFQDEAERWKRRSKTLETEMEHTYDDMGSLEEKLMKAQIFLKNNNINGFESSGGSRSRKQQDQPRYDADDIGGTDSHQTSHERRSIRRKAQHVDDIDL